MTLLSRLRNQQKNLVFDRVVDMSQSTRLSESLFAAVCYLLPPLAALAWLWLGKNSLFVSFHAKQALFVQIIGFVLISLTPWLFKWFIVAILLIILFLGVYYSLRKLKWYIPLISGISDKIEI